MREASTVTVEASTGAQLIFIESFANSYSLSSNSEMPRYYCYYCDTYLMHDSPSVRKQHNAGHKHKANVRSYNQLYEAQLNQSLIDQKVKEHLRAFRPPIASNVRHGLPVLPTPLPGQS